jgi:hypothetical protein
MIFYEFENVNLKVNQRLKSKVQELFNNNFQNGKIIRLDIEPFYSEIGNLVVNSEEKELLKNTRHAELLYIYRNNLIHEFRQPGYGMEFSNDNASPYYHGMTDLDSHIKTYELVYPINFFMNLSKIALASIKAFLTSNALDPFSFFKFGSPW